jgi:hypothetical protein
MLGGQTSFLESIIIVRLMFESFQRMMIVYNLLLNGHAVPV